MKALEMGSNKAVTILAKTSATVTAEAEVQPKNTRAQYKNILNHYIREAN